MSTRLNRTLRSYWFWVGVMIFASFPFWLGDYQLGIALKTLIFIGFCLAWNISGGISGQFSFAHTLYIAIGAYTPAALFVHYGLNPWVGLLIGVVLAVGLGAFVTWVCHRFNLPKLSIALITLAFGEIGLLVIQSWDFIGSQTGLVIPRVEHPSLISFQFVSIYGYFYIMLIFALFSLLVTIKLFDSKVGFYCQAIRDNESAAKALGINTLKYKMTAMMLSAALCSIAGTVFAQYLLFVEPNTFAGTVLMIETILMTVLGGLGTIWGPVIGPVIMVPVSEYLNGQLGGQLPGLSQLIYGILIILVILLIPKGLVSLKQYIRWRNISNKENVRI